ncbi:gamma-interferon-inducible lysosomal thiol reductase-like [Xenia sp. Carnegie-2017]|uniref:gamma-interferon-inducible lysosomal thiol reductase-like n=1 Tax=Xenia sp. Carnegie-2017 TaxID=2897299 RepID=UPI001F048E77|nr:gamma-interferon-inducible lysosomal thiol reductase-like [Xenia sp. Carnegie-2017]
MNIKDIFVIIFVVAAYASAKSCNLPPSLWCSSRQVAIKCDVEEQCHPYFSLLSRSNVELVNFTLYMESLCPDCQNFVNNQLWPAFKAVGEIMNLVIVPYGNAIEKKNDSKWKFMCQHGEEECYGNLIETCAIHYNQNASVFMPFIHCIESSSLLPRNNAPKCAKKFGLDYSLIISCVKGRLGNELEHKMAKKTNALEPPHTYVPWVTLNGVHTDAIQTAAQENLVKLICDTYQGSPKPDACLPSKSKTLSRA